MSRTKFLSILLAICLVAVCVYLGTSYLKDRNEQLALKAKIASASQTLSLIPAPSDNVAQRLAEAQKTYDAARQDMLPEKLSSTVILKEVLAAAGEYQIKVIPITSDEWTNTTIGENSYRTLSIELNTESTFDNLVEFVRRLDSSEFSSLAVESVSIDRNSEAAERGMVSGILELAVFTQPQEEQ